MVSLDPSPPLRVIQVSSSVEISLNTYRNRTFQKASRPLCTAGTWPAAQRSYFLVIRCECLSCSPMQRKYSDSYSNRMVSPAYQPQARLPSKPFRHDWMIHWMQCDEVVCHGGQSLRWEEQPAIYPTHVDDNMVGTSVADTDNNQRRQLNPWWIILLPNCSAIY